MLQNIQRGNRETKQETEQQQKKKQNVKHIQTYHKLH